MRALFPSIPSWSARQKLFVLLAVIAIVAGWRLIAWGALRSSRNLANNLAAVTVFVGPAYPDHSGTQLLFEQNTETGLGIHTADMRTQKRRLVFNVEEAFVRSGSVGVLGWSPDGSVFGYTIPVKSNRQHIVVCSGYVGERIDYFRVDSQVASFAWLAADKFAYADEENVLRVIARNKKGKWAESLKVPRSGSRITDLFALPNGAVAWKQGRSIYRMTLTSGEPEVLWQSDSAFRVDLACFAGVNTLLIGVAEGRRSYSVVSLFPGPPRVTNVLQEIEDRRITGLRLINGGKGYALLSADPGGNTLLISSDGQPAGTPLFAEGNVQHVTPHGQKLYITGSTNVEPPGIWEYDCKDGALKCVLSGSDKVNAQGQFRHETRVLAIGSREVTYHLWTPEPTMYRKKFPVIIGQTPYTWTPYPHVAVMAGFCFVTVDRPSWHTDLDQWADDVMGVYENLKSHPRVDVSKAYLYGRSAETSYLSSLAAQTPQLWKGALLFSPGMLPDLHQCRFPKMFVDVGERDHNTLQRLTKFQAEAAVLGVPVRVLVHETSRHTSWSQATQRARLENLGVFLCRQ